MQKQPLKLYRTLAKTMRKGLAPIAIIAATWAVAPLAQADESRLDLMVKELGISESQKQSLKPIIESNQAARRVILQQYGIDPEARKRPEQKLSRSDRKAMHQALKDNKQKADQQLASILTPEQMEQLKQLREKKKGEFKARRLEQRKHAH